MPAQKPYTFAIHTSRRLTKNCKRVCLANADGEKGRIKHENLTKAIPNKGFGGKLKDNASNKH